MSRVIAYCPLHYGAEYLDVSIRSVDPFVEVIYILYTDKPSYGFGTRMKCPDSEEQLKEIAFKASNKIKWIRVDSGSEGHHRGIISKYWDGYDVVLAFDADEVFDQKDLPNAIRMAAQSENRYLGVNGYVNFWRSFDWACYDGFTPVRFYNLKRDSGTGTVYCKIYHFSTAQGMDTMRYKLDIHGHKSEIRQGWLEDKYEAWTPENNIQDLHLVSIGLWNAVPFDKTQLPEMLKEHPNYNKGLI